MLELDECTRYIFMFVGSDGGGLGISTIRNEVSDILGVSAESAATQCTKKDKALILMVMIKLRSELFLLCLTYILFCTQV